MKKKEAVIRYLALVGRANLYQIAAYIVASSSIVSRSGLVPNVKWSDSSKAWVLTPEGYRMHDFYQLRDKKQEV
jgi:hypothetical protein